MPGRRRVMKNKLCLGTVQLGTKYGIKNEIGRQPTDEESFKVLQMAIESGVEYFDTASIYGNAEELLGRFHIGDYPVKVISKLSPGTAESEYEVLQKIEKSLQSLNMNSLDGYMLHDATEFYQSFIVKGLCEAKRQGLVQHIGVSIYESEDALAAVKSRWVDYIQIPYNVLDQRLNQTDFFEIAEKKDIKVFARSCFLQGLLLMDTENVPEYLTAARSYLEEFNHIIKKYGYSKIEAAFLFSYTNKDIYRVVFGVDTALQLETNLNIVKKAESFAACYVALQGRFLDVERKVIIPSLWNKREALK